MGKRMILQDYSKKREVIEYPKLYSVGSVRCSNFSLHTLMIYIPNKVRMELRITRYNESDFRVIIYRKRK